MRLIDGDELKTAFPSCDNSVPILVASVRATIDYMPTIDAVEVVRCRDCIWYLKDGSCARHLKQFEPYNYCSYGERGEHDENE